MVKNGCGHFGPRTLKLALSQVGISRIHKLFACGYKFRKGKSYDANNWAGMVENGCGYLSRKTLKSAISNKLN